MSLNGTGGGMDIDHKLPTDPEAVLEKEIREWNFYVYFKQKNVDEVHAARELRDAVLRVRREGAFVAVPYFRVNEEPSGPHTIGSYEIWVPGETFSSVLSYLCQHRGNLSVLIVPITKEPLRDFQSRCTWMGPPVPLDTSVVPATLDNQPASYTSLKLGYSAQTKGFGVEHRRTLGQNAENILKNERNAARAV